MNSFASTHYVESPLVEAWLRSCFSVFIPGKLMTMLITLTNRAAQVWSCVRPRRHTSEFRYVRTLELASFANGLLDGNNERHCAMRCRVFIQK
jgi:hypothetical protein